MINVTPEQPVKSNAPQRLERFHIYLLLVLGVALFGAGIIAVGFAAASAATVGVGAGAVLAAGIIAVSFALAGSRVSAERERSHRRHPYPATSPHQPNKPRSRLAAPNITGKSI